MFGLPFFRPPKPVAPRPQKVAQPGFDDSIPPGLSPKQILSEIVEEAIKLHGLSAARPAKLVRREGNQVMVLIELQGDTPEQDTMQMVDNMVAQNADASAKQVSYRDLRSDLENLDVLPLQPLGHGPFASPDLPRERVPVANCPSLSPQLPRPTPHLEDVGDFKVIVINDLLGACAS